MLLVALLFFSSAEQTVYLKDGEKVSCEWVSGSGSWTAVQADSLKKQIAGRNIVYRSVDVDVAEPGVISVHLKNNKGTEKLNVFGVDIVDVDGKGISASYSSSVTDDSLGCVYTLNDVIGGECRLRYFVDGNGALNSSNGVVTLGFVSQKKMAEMMLANLLQEAHNLCDANAETDEQAVLIAMLQLMCDKYEELLATQNAPLEELEEACDALAKVIK